MTVRISLPSVKSADGWGEAIYGLGLPDDVAGEFFEYQEYADLELEIAYVEGDGGRPGRLHVVGGEITRRDGR